MLADKIEPKFPKLIPDQVDALSKTSIVSTHALSRWWSEVRRWQKKTSKRNKLPTIAELSEETCELALAQIETCFGEIDKEWANFLDKHGKT